jgi:hypothetical protein
MAEQKYLFLVMDDDKVAHPEYLAGDAAVLDAVKRSVFDYRDGAEWDPDHITEAEGIATTLIEDGYFPFEGDPPLYLFQLPDGEPVAWMHEFTDPHSGSRYREPRQHRPADYERQPGDTVRPLMYADGVTVDAPSREQFVKRAMDLAFQWAHASYCKGLGRPFSDIEPIRAQLREHLTAGVTGTPEPKENGNG